MLVVGSRGVGAFTAMILGSVSRYAATHASSPVVVVRDEVGAAHRQVGIGISSQEGNEAALTFAFEEAALRKASLIAVHAWHTPQADMSRAGDQFTAEGRDFLETEASRHLEALLDEWRAKYPDVPVSQDVVHGHPGRTLAGLSARTDLLVLGQARRPPRLRRGHPRGPEPRARPDRHRSGVLVRGGATTAVTGSRAHDWAANPRLVRRSGPRTCPCGSRRDLRLRPGVGAVNAAERCPVRGADRAK